ncbi:MAG: methyltransferase domain-containing protein [Candidatus Lokiarchaeota archaeon]|nr:methyltransferase domain-containing protein [Candidatus Lokiarchaeota archaeon]
MGEKIDWHDRFTHQLKWTKSFRERIYKKLNFGKLTNLLEIGCGTGALLLEIGSKFNLKLHGIDVNAARINAANQNLKKKKIRANLYTMDIKKNSFKDATFDVIVCNLVFLWMDELDIVFQEIHRILKRNGFLIIFCEPDYGGLIEYPDTGLKSALIKNLRELGADPEIARKLGSYFCQNDQFSLFDQYIISVPWISISDEMKNNMLKELSFFDQILEIGTFNRDKMKHAIKQGSYFLFNPAFSFILSKK